MKNEKFIDTGIFYKKRHPPNLGECLVSFDTE